MTNHLTNTIIYNNQKKKKKRFCFSISISKNKYTYLENWCKINLLFDFLKTHIYTKSKPHGCQSNYITIFHRYFLSTQQQQFGKIHWRMVNVFRTGADKLVLFPFHDFVTLALWCILPSNSIFHCSVILQCMTVV